MPTLLQINTVINSGSTGHIAEELGNLVMEKGWVSYIAYGRNPRPSNSIPIKIGTKFDVYLHVLLTRVFDRHGYGSFLATKKLIKQIEKIKPDIIHLHNIHGYYLNIKLLFTYLKTLDTPIIWTLHDCWSFTGHCSHYTAVGCSKWKTGCFSCPQCRQYPKSFYDNSKNNYKVKKSLFSGVKDLTIITPSNWLAEEVRKSYLSAYPVKVIHNGIDLNIFKPIEKSKKNIYNKNEKKIILGVASVWNERKGFQDFVELSKMLLDDEEIILVGLSEKQIASLPKKYHIRGICRTENQSQLAELYSDATVFVNPTYEDTFPTTNIESIACGTPVITYKTGGSPEIIDENTGFVVAPHDLNELRNCIDKIEYKEKGTFSIACRRRAENCFMNLDNFRKYIDLYISLTKL